jgi:hypothetical protein
MFATAYSRAFGVLVLELLLSYSLRTVMASCSSSSCNIARSAFKTTMIATSDMHHLLLDSPAPQQCTHLQRIMVNCSKCLKLVNPIPLASGSWLQTTWLDASFSAQNVGFLAFLSVGEPRGVL